MEKVTFRRFDAAEYLGSEEAIAGFLEDSAESGDPAVILNALATVARARDMTALAQKVAMSRSGLYKALSSEGNPSFALVDKIAKSMGFRVSLVPMTPNVAKPAKKATKKRPRIVAMPEKHAA